MIYYIIRRLLQIIPVLIGITILLFVLMYIIPEDPAQLILQKGATEQALANLRAKMGIDQPIYVQYWRYVRQLAKGDLGQSYRYRRSVNSILADHYPNSVKLALAAIFIEIIIITVIRTADVKSAPFIGTAACSCNIICKIRMTDSCFAVHRINI